MSTPEKLTPDQLKEFFPPARNLIKPGVFELGLVLAGTVSAGAYTAGVLDFLMEAMDAWERAKEEADDLAPPHEVVISTISGASGGGINGAILLRAAAWQFPHGPNDANPFYATWKNGVSLIKLLAPGPDAGAPGFASVLKCESIDRQAADTINAVGKPLEPPTTPDIPNRRSYFANPLRLFTTVGNLSGVPYTIQMAGESSLTHELFSHGDYMRFALAVPDGVPNTPESRPDEVALSSSSTTNWNFLQNAALATSAFPLAFRARSLVRPLETSGYRVVVVPEVLGADTKIVQLVPNWDSLQAGEPDAAFTTFANVDGGAFNNEPLDHVRNALAGYARRNDRSPKDADRAIIMVDPFSDPDTLSRPDTGRLLKVAGAVITSLVSQARFKPVDIALAYDENTFSRFLIAPVGSGPDNKRTPGTRAIASGALGGFSGFIDTTFLDYDFRLGRQNAWGFLREHLAIPVSAGNKIFADWTPAQIAKYKFTGKDGVDYLPLIPLMDSLEPKLPKTMPPWPRLTVLPADVPAAVQGRLQSVYEMLKTALIGNSFWARTGVNIGFGPIWSLFLRSKLRDMVVNALTDGLIAHGLLPKSPPKK